MWQVITNVYPSPCLSCARRLPVFVHGDGCLLNNAGEVDPANDPRRRPRIAAEAPIPSAVRNFVLAVTLCKSDTEHPSLHFILGRTHDDEFTYAAGVAKVYRTKSTACPTLQISAAQDNANY
jgi:hypothetical protein